MRKNYSDCDNNTSYIKKLLVLGVAAVALGLMIKRIIDQYMESTEKINKLSSGGKEFSSKFESKEIKPSCSFKKGGIRTMCSKMTFNLTDCYAKEDMSITCNAIASAVDIIAPDNVNVVPIDISKASCVCNKACEPFNVDLPTMYVYISGFASCVLIKRHC